MQNHESSFNHAITSDVKVEFSSQTNLIEQSSYRYSQQERANPN